MGSDRRQAHGRQYSGRLPADPVTISRRVRPLRLAFLADARDHAMFLRVMRLCACRWGGRYNAIVPVFARRPSWQRDAVYRRHSAKDVARGQLESFEPDLIVECREGLAERLGVPDRLVVGIDEADRETEGRSVTYGIGVFSVFRQFFEREFQFVRRFQAGAVVPHPARNADVLLVASVFGTFPEETERQFYERAYIDTFDAVAVEITPEAFADVLLRTPPRYTPLRAAARGLEILPGAHHPDLLFALDPSDPLDLVEFWNLRALGLRVLPVPVDWMEPWADAYVSTRSVELADSAWWDSPNVIGSLRLADEHRERLMTALRERAGEEIELTRGFFPPLWDARGLYLNHFSRAEVTWQTSDIEVTAGDERVQFECEGPEFAGDGMSFGPSWACVVNLRARLGGGIAEVFPPATGDITRDLDALGSRPITTSTEGIVIRGDGSRDLQFWRLPNGEAAFRAWFREQGVDAQVSGAGRTSLEVLRAVGGTTQGSILASAELVRLLGRAAEGLAESPRVEGETVRRTGRVIGQDDLARALGRANPGNPQAVRRHARLLTSLGVIHPHVRLECTQCGQRNWISPEDLASEIRCEHCLRLFPFPADKPPARGDWGYRPRGAFAVTGFARGAYTVALALHFFSDFGFVSGRRTWTVGMDLIDGDESLEIDFGVFLARDDWREGTRVAVLLGEAKTFGRFERKDMRRGAQLLDRFDDSIFVMATLRDALDDDERDAIRRMVLKRRTRSGWLTRRGRIVVLTANELATRGGVGLRHTWTDLGGRHADLAASFQGLDSDLGQLSEATLRMYADLAWPDRDRD
ncbi:MAG: hypothetical protein QOE11_2905 [Solirubrobacteraceae bacterium]|nr:hypothetical protein [Solirubrobacteraceae bacterium]